MKRISLGIKDSDKRFLDFFYPAELWKNIYTFWATMLIAFCYSSKQTKIFLKQNHQG